MTGLINKAIVRHTQEQTNQTNKSNRDNKMTDTAKQRLIDSLENYIEEKSKSGGVSDQGNVMFAHDVLEEIKALNLMQCQKLENAIIAKNVSAQSADLKYGFGYTPVSPINYGGFIAGIV